MIVQCGKCKTKVNILIENNSIKNPVFTCPACHVINKLNVPKPEIIPTKNTLPAGWLIYKTATENKTYELKIGLNTIGRKTENNTATVQLDIEDKTISRFHISIEVLLNKAGVYEYLVFDNNSVNGSFINTEALKPGNQLYLNHEDVIQLGTTKLILKTPYSSATKDEESKTILNNEDQKTIIV